MSAKTFIKKLIPNSLLKWHQERLLNKQRESFHKGCLELLYYVDDILTKANIPYWLNYGTLLGVYRDNDFIPHDYDLDVGIMLENHLSVKDLMLDNGLKPVFEAHMGGTWDSPDIVEYRFEYKGVSIDFNTYKKKGENIIETLDFVMVKEINYNLNLGSRQPILVEGVTIPFTGLKTIEFKGRSFSIPENTEGYLIANYGPSWRVPVKDFDYHDYAENITIYKRDEKYGEVIIFK